LLLLDKGDDYRQVFVQGGAEHVTRIVDAFDGCDENGFVGRLQALLEQKDILFDHHGYHSIIINNFIWIEKQQTKEGETKADLPLSAELVDLGAGLRRLALSVVAATLGRTHP